MEPKTAAWASLIVILLLSSFGVFGLLTALAGVFVFFLGAFSLLYLKLGDIDTFYAKCAGNPLTSTQQSDGGLKAIKAALSSPKKVPKSDNRVTGSELIDSSLQEILGYIIRDYIEPWYRVISVDSEFPQRAVRQTAQTFAINISNRIKEVDWIPYLTQRLVDDAATHLRLYKQARAKIKMQEKQREARHSPAKEARASPKKTIHKRNKSETDVSWYNTKSSDFRRDVEKVVGNSKFFSPAAKDCTLEEHFFKLELQMEKNRVCRLAVCTDLAKEKEFLCEIMEVLLYILLPDEDFQCKPLRFLLRDIFANGVILPLFDLVADPDYINQAMLWICLRNMPISSEMFLTALRMTECPEELKSTKELVESEMHNLRSRDAGGEDLAVKQQLNSLAYVVKLIDSRLVKMETSGCMDAAPTDKIPRIDLSLEQILQDSLGLSYFMDFVSSQGRQQDLFFFLNIEGWRDSLRKELLDPSENASLIYEKARSTALGIYEQFLGGEEERVDINEDLAQSLRFKIRNLNERPSESWFETVKRVLFEKMESESLAAFKSSKTYIKMLHELDLVPQSIAEEDSGSLNSMESLEGEALKPNRLLAVEQSPKPVKHARSFSDVTMFKGAENGQAFNPHLEDDAARLMAKNQAETLKTGEYGLGVNIIETGIVCEKGKTFGIYAIRVSRQYSSGYLEEWHIYRRYSDFYDLYIKVREKYPDLSKIAFPGKKTFHNMERAVLERRMKMLGTYMAQLCQNAVINAHRGLRELLMTFLEQGEYDKATGGPISTTINTLVNPIKSGMKTIKNMPEHLINTVDEVVGGLSKVFQSKGGKLPETSKVGASIEESDDNIPLRIMLLLMDEVFDLKSRNQWLRRRIVTILRQIVRTMFGDIVNRRILDYVSYVTSPKNVAHYLYVFKQSFWPNGLRNDRKPDRGPDTKNRTRVATKAALLSSLSDELKHIIGSETTRRGLLSIFELFQRPTLNRRLLYVLLEGVLCSLFPEKEFMGLFEKLHAESQCHSNSQNR